MVSEFAAAKINLALHVTGRRPDGYHLLDSLVAFANIGDRITVALADRTDLSITGPFGAGLIAEDDNLVLRAARLFDPDIQVAITLEKNLPLASGIGGGSADAAATLRALVRMTARELPSRQATLALGADVPVCLASRPVRMRGIGEDKVPINLPPCWITLVNPQVPVPTATVFAALQTRDNPALPPDLPDWKVAADLAAWLHQQRNDLEAPARGIAPVIAVALAALARQTGALIARMSGSGATCFALFADEAACRAATATLAKAHTEWWVAAGRLTADGTGIS